MANAYDYTNNLFRIIYKLHLPYEAVQISRIHVYIPLEFNGRMVEPSKKKKIRFNDLET